MSAEAAARSLAKPLNCRTPSVMTFLMTFTSTYLSTSAFSFIFTLPFTSISMVEVHLRGKPLSLEFV